MKTFFAAVSIMCAAAAFGQESIFSYRTGSFEVYMLVENQRPGGIPSVLIGADKALLDRYIPGGKTVSETNTFLVRGGGKTILIDTGFGGAVFDSMKKLGVLPEDVDAVLLTHMHGDHIGGLAKNGKALFSKALVYLDEKEKEYWTVTNVSQSAVAALAPYGNRVKTFRGGEPGPPPGGQSAALAELVPGIGAVAAYGHTPGHSCFLIQSGGERLLVWGDLIHVQDIQFPRPDISVTYDTDPAAAAETRKKILRYAAENKIPIAGMHLVYPAIGTVSGDGAGGWTLTPAAGRY